MPIKNSEYIYRRVEELALSGLYAGPAEIMIKIVSEGYPQAIAMFNTELIRKDIRRQCDLASTVSVSPQLWSLDAWRP